MLPLIGLLTREYAQLLNCDPNELVFVSNGTTANNTVLQNVDFKKGDVVFCFDILYGSTKKLLNHLESY